MNDEQNKNVHPVYWIGNDVRFGRQPQCTRSIRWYSKKCERTKTTIESIHNRQPQIQRTNSTKCRRIKSCIQTSQNRSFFYFSHVSTNVLVSIREQERWTSRSLDSICTKNKSKKKQTIGRMYFYYKYTWIAPVPLIEITITNGIEHTNTYVMIFFSVRVKWHPARNHWEKTQFFPELHDTKMCWLLTNYWHDAFDVYAPQWLFLHISSHRLC